MPLFTYTITRGSEVRAAQLRKSNPQGWLLQAVTATYPDVASRRADDILRLRLQRVKGAHQRWDATLTDSPADLDISVAETKE